MLACVKRSDVNPFVIIYMFISNWFNYKFFSETVIDYSYIYFVVKSFSYM